MAQNVFLCVSISEDSFESEYIYNKHLIEFNITSSILLVVLYGCETWPLTLREECRLRVFENRILRRIFGPKRHENG